MNTEKSIDTSLSEKAVFTNSDKAIRFRNMLEKTSTHEVRGKLTQILGTIVRASIKNVKVGELCELIDPETGTNIKAEVVGFSKNETLLTPIGELSGLSPQTQVIRTGKKQQINVGKGIIGRVIDGSGEPIDGKEPLPLGKMRDIFALPTPPMQRQVIRHPISTGGRAIDSMLTCGEGQRLGIFASAGGGKSTLLSMITKGSDADVIVIALIGERGREVREFVERDLGDKGLEKSVVIAATSDRPALERVNAAHVATSIAEHFRDEGKKVLLLMDSITRFARAQREIGLATGEPPARRGFPPSVFANLPKLLERTGPGKHGSITALYTVLVEGGDLNEPIADEVRSILDGHIVLSRALAEAGHYPAIDVLASVSRLMTSITNHEHQGHAKQLRAWMAKYKEVELLLNIGEYQKGNDIETDTAIEKQTDINHFLRQATDDHSSIDETVTTLSQLVTR